KSTFDGKSKTLLIKDEKAPFYIIAGTNNNIASMEGGVLFGSHTQESIYLDWIKQNRLTNLIQNPSLENTMESNANHPTGWSTYSRRGRVQFSMVKGKEGNGVRINNTIHGDRGTVQ